MATAIVALYDQGGAPLGVACWPVGLADAVKGFTALHYHRAEAYSVWVADDASGDEHLARLRLAMSRLLQHMELGVVAYFVSCGVEEKCTSDGIILSRDATYVSEKWR